MCGFVPWRLRKLHSGDCVPEVLPLGTFSWTVQGCCSRKRQLSENTVHGDFQSDTSLKKKKSESSHGSNETNKTVQPSIFRKHQAILRKQIGVNDDEVSKTLRFKINIQGNIDVKPNEVEIYEFEQPSYSSCTDLVSPMSHILSLYREIEHYRKLYLHADNWNCQAKLLCSYTTIKDNYSIKEGNPITNDWNYPQRMGLNTDTNLPVEFEENMNTRDFITESLVNSKNALHRPVIYSLPQNTVLQPTPKLDTIRKIEDMQERYREAIESLMGVYRSNRITSKESTKWQQLGNICPVRHICHHLQELLQQVYVASYGVGTTEVRFLLSPASRITIRDTDDFIKLLQCGLVTSQDAYTLSNMILSPEMLLCTGKPPTAGKNAQIFVTPSNKVADDMAHIAAKKVHQDAE